MPEQFAYFSYKIKDIFSFSPAKFTELCS